MQRVQQALHYPEETEAPKPTQRSQASSKKHTHSHTHTHTHTHAHTHTQTHTPTHTLTHTQTNTHPNTNTHTHSHTHKHTYTHTHMRARNEYRYMHKCSTFRYRVWRQGLTDTESFARERGWGFD